MLSHRLTPEERQRLRIVCSQLDGIPFVEKAKFLRASVEELGAHRRSLRPVPRLAPGHPTSRAA
jgi:hypothetical protein